MFCIIFIEIAQAAYLWSVFALECVLVVGTLIIGGRNIIKSNKVEHDKNLIKVLETDKKISLIEKDVDNHKELIDENHAAITKFNDGIDILRRDINKDLKDHRIEVIGIVKKLMPNK